VCVVCWIRVSTHVCMCVYVCGRADSIGGTATHIGHAVKTNITHQPSNSTHRKRKINSIHANKQATLITTTKHKNQAKHTQVSYLRGIFLSDLSRLGLEERLLLTLLRCELLSLLTLSCQRLILLTFVLCDGLSLHSRLSGRSRLLRTSEVSFRVEKRVIM
jgi:hypothetical protein